MKKEEVEKHLSEFTMRCLLNESIYDYKESIKIVESHIEKAETVDEFINLIMNDERLEGNQGYWELAKETQTRGMYNILVKKYLGKICEKHFQAISDCGGIKIGNNGCSVILNNGGEENKDIYIINENIGLSCLEFIGSVEGDDINIYDYDCGNYSEVKLSGRYGIYSSFYDYSKRRSLGSHIMALVKWE